MRLGEAVGLLKSDINLDCEIPHINLVPHPLETFKDKRKSEMYTTYRSIFVGIKKDIR
jgi:hypothetical protein